MTSAVDSELAVLWEGLRSSGDPQIREQLILRYARYARAIAAGLYRTRCDDATPFDEYLQYARVGLMEAVDRYDDRRGATFETFSSYRIRGAILTGVTRDTEAGAQRSFWRTRMADREESLAEAALRQPQHATFEDFVHLAAGLAVGMVLEGPEVEPIDEAPEANPYLAAELAQSRARLRGLVEALPEREREVMRQHYYQHREFQDIAARLGVTKGRVSQLHLRAIEHIRASLAAEPRIDRRL
ncbi:MAG TPA: sigma-70 family RNA polymerase sigma factor [Steroidobacteraceae bacterium]|nr:sigma-70 family RNA polymerase sigma factor [Steroidobacteraceae bacterium]